MRWNRSSASMAWAKMPQWAETQIRSHQHSSLQWDYLGSPQQQHLPSVSAVLPTDALWKNTIISHFYSGESEMTSLYYVHTQGCIYRVSITDLAELQHFLTVILRSCYIQACRVFLNLPLSIVMWYFFHITHPWVGDVPWNSSLQDSLCWHKNGSPVGLETAFRISITCKTVRILQKRPNRRCIHFSMSQVKWYIINILCQKSHGDITTLFFWNWKYFLS